MGLPSSADNISHEQVVAVLAHLNFLLANLPKQLPTVDGPDSRYGTFLSFALDPEILEKTGDEVATLGEQFESIFGWKACTSGDGIIPILEQGKVICALQHLLKKYHEKYPENNVLKKWVIDITTGTEKVFALYKIAMHVLYL